MNIPPQCQQELFRLAQEMTSALACHLHDQDATQSDWQYSQRLIERFKRLENKLKDLDAMHNDWPPALLTRTHKKND